jgi:hypothetical protein
MAKISVSIDDSDLRWLKRRARAVHGGNLSAAIAEGTRLLRHHEALGALLDELEAPALTPAESDALGAELLGSASKKKRRARRAA